MCIIAAGTLGEIDAIHYCTHGSKSRSTYGLLRTGCDCRSRKIKIRYDNRLSAELERVTKRN